MQTGRGAAQRLFAVRGPVARRALSTPQRPTDGFNERRDVYRQRLKELRRQFREEHLEGVAATKTLKEAASVDETERALRAARKHEVSTKRFAEHKERIARAKARRAERKKMLFSGWVQGEQMSVERQSGIVEALTAASKEWVTAETLDAHIERAVDEMTISSGARTELAAGSAAGN